MKDGYPFDWRLYNDRITQQPGRGTLVIKSPRDEDVGKFSFSLLQGVPCPSGIFCLNDNNLLRSKNAI